MNTAVASGVGELDSGRRARGLAAGWAAVSWPEVDALDALEALARASGLAPDGGLPNARFERDRDRSAAVDSRDDGVDDPRFVRRLVRAAACLGIEAEPVETTCAELEGLLRRAGPALLRVAVPGDGRLLCLLGGTRGGRRLRVLAPDGAVVEVPADAVRAALAGKVKEPLLATVERVIDRAQLGGVVRARAHAALLGEILSTERVGGCVLLRAAPGASLPCLAGEARLGRLAVKTLLGHVLVAVLYVASWWLLGRGALEGRLDRGWLLGWGLLLLTLVPLRLLVLRSGGLLAIRGATLVKRRILAGALRMEVDEVRHLGVGGLLGRVLEAESLEQMAIAGGFFGIGAVIELLLALGVLACGAGGWLHVLLLVAWIVLAASCARRYLRMRSMWTERRFALTNDLVERMVGHRTRLAQESKERRHDGEDRALESYQQSARMLDSAGVLLTAFLPRGWFVAGLCGLVPAFVSGEAKVVSLALGIGGVLLAYQAFRDLGEGLEHLIAARISWESVAPFWRAAAREEVLGTSTFDPADAPEPAAGESSTSASSSAASEDDAARARPVIEARGLAFGYCGRAAPVLTGVDLSLGNAERVLLQGASGGGKSTLAMVLASSRKPDAGLLLLHGLDRETVGTAAWRRAVLVVPQFHENHVLQGSFAFNLLMGRAWPPGKADFEEAERVCRELGLGPVLERMPAGLLQPVGETGWQLSHGERSRLFVARALLQSAEVTILDESFAALDPETLQRTLGIVLERARALVVIAHP